MRVSSARPYVLFAAAALFAGCAGAGSTVPHLSANARMPAAGVRTAQDHVRVTCGADRDDCRKIRLVAPLGFSASFRGMTISLSSTTCAHAHVRIDDGRLPLLPQTYTAASRFGFLALTVEPMNDPCAHRDRDPDARRPMVLVTPTPTPTQVTGNTEYYVLALIQAPDGSYTTQTLDGPAQETGTTLAFSSPVIERSVQGTYAFYLAKIRPDDGGRGGDGGHRHGHNGDGD